MEILDELRRVRKARGLTLARAATLTGLNLSQISQIENANVDPRLSSIRALAGLLDLALVLVPREAVAQVRRLAGGGPIAAADAAADPPAAVDRLRVPVGEP
jgi:transcriptional regulator with XRE-family HTH domain